MQAFCGEEEKLVPGGALLDERSLHSTESNFDVGPVLARHGQVEEKPATAGGRYHLHLRCGERVFKKGLRWNFRHTSHCS